MRLYFGMPLVVDSVDSAGLPLNDSPRFIPADEEREEVSNDCYTQEVTLDYLERRDLRDRQTYSM